MKDDHPDKAAKYTNGLTYLNPPGWPKPKTYANGIKARGEMVFVGGLVGWDEQQCVPQASSRRPSSF